MELFDFEEIKNKVNRTKYLEKLTKYQPSMEKVRGEE